MSESYRYAPEVFLHADPASAKAIILTCEQGLTPEERWDKETDWLLGGAPPRIAFPAGALVLDYGCGIGRIAKQLPHTVLGVDISLTMRTQAEVYVGRANFGGVNPAMLAELARFGLRCQGAVAVWVLQHCLNVAHDIQVIASVLDRGASFVVVNRSNRAVPVTDGASLTWWNDGVDIDELLSRHFIKQSEEAMPETLCAPGATMVHWQRNDVEAMAVP